MRVLEPGQIIGNGRYHVEGILGSGGMATVYRVRDTRLRIARALKVLDPQLSARPGLRQRFEVEAHSMAKLSHPNIVKVFDVVDDGANFYIVMEIVEGSSVLEKTNDGPMELKPALEITLGVLRALEAAHAAKIIHRDIKPHNLLIAEDGSVRVSDFGIAQCADFGDRSMTRTGAVMGTWAFMSPEQRADAKGVEPASDIYSTGATLYAMVTGLTPPDLFAADIDPAMYKDVPPPVREIIKSATRYWAWERYSSADDMASDVELVLARVKSGRGLAGLELKLKDAEPNTLPMDPSPTLQSSVEAEPEVARHTPSAPRLAATPTTKPPEAGSASQRRTPRARPSRDKTGAGWLVGALAVVGATTAYSAINQDDEPVVHAEVKTEPTPQVTPRPEADVVPVASKKTKKGGLAHTPPTQGSIHEQIELRAEVSDSQAYDQVTTYFRAIGSPAWRTTKMNKAGGGFRGYLPADRTMTAGVEYYIEAKSYRSNTPPLYSGSAAKPHRLKLQP